MLTLARLYRTALGHLGRHGLPKVTGKRGHPGLGAGRAAATPSTRRATGSRALSRAVGAPCRTSSAGSGRSAIGRGRARLDYTQNAVNKTLVAPYAVRPSAGAPVSAPISWEELDDPDLRPDRWTIQTMGARIKKVGDLYAPATELAQELPPL